MNSIDGLYRHFLEGEGASTLALIHLGDSSTVSERALVTKGRNLDHSTVDDSIASVPSKSKFRYVNI